MNAQTMDALTQYPVASLSEEQLLSLADFYVDSCFHPMIMEYICISVHCIRVC